MSEYLKVYFAVPLEPFYLHFHKFIIFTKYLESLELLIQPSSYIIKSTEVRQSDTK